MNVSLVLGAITTAIMALVIGHHLSPIVSSKQQIWDVYHQEIVIWLVMVWITISGIMYLLVGRFQGRSLRRLSKMKEQFEAGKLEVKR